ncbi:MAG: bifunctional tetrahydrofolate synthase/dihydrofolate synthase [Thermomonas sp.]|uniref:bifunctional tetrahydrofolate synthase/dihydrofolate synthase n=1 Tax=Thermomonas sp. TaxID=1971895 RepID=UPI001B47C371|nr:bifunctional tetrahydrofolate synthase/dihydrofolate synthase [Thermomonas sp.]MBP6438562.1 bifunctional tetrahydrofolate synthase/dihydrofolate synthase [Thermomonas sp.]MBP7787511.1 bifunctional tetrahydrofolate synthase/dihydrofolate synthase [Thermomonas sp.]MBP8647064.1 bifunctional tetrahydrofolate synthase/dihydrofolate synthase [Thermomonas sp.]
MPRTLADWLAHIERQHPKSIDMGLQRVREVAARMRLPRPAKRVITVGGTNGKGSTVAFVEAIARAHGWKVGCYTSPHLLRYNERVRIDGVDAGDAALVAGFEAVEAARGDTPLTYFEYGTLCALWLFARSKLDLAVLEVGLGGRLDAVNVVDADASIITTVDLDHQDWLGEDIEAIGFEKAGIARPFKPLVLGDDDPPASVLRHAYAIGAQSWRIANDFFAEPLDAETWRWREVGFSMDLPMPALAAPVQLRNAASAIAAVRTLRARIDKQTYAEGVANARVAGRLQRFERNGVEVVVDVGHNPQAARALAEWLRAQPRRRTLAVYAALADKDVAGVAQALAGVVDGWHIAGLSDAGPRGLGVDDFARQLAGTAAADAARHVGVDAALQAAMAQAGPGGRVLVFGSFHTAAAALGHLGADG